MPLFNSQHQNDRGIRWRGIAATAMVELLVLFALAFAVVRYVEWSSAVNQAEFMSATEPSQVSERTLRYWIADARPVPHAVKLLLNLMIAKEIKPEDVI
jgi:hypothetical protein